jgi:hypothetical protein
MNAARMTRSLESQEGPATARPAVWSPCPGPFPAQNKLCPPPYARAGCRAFSSYTYRFAPGQPGQPGQTPESLANRPFCKSYLNIYTGTQPGHAGTLRYQDVAGHTKGRPSRHRRQRFAAAGVSGCRRLGSRHRPGHLSRPALWSGSFGRGLKHSQRRSKSGAGA